MHFACIHNSWMNLFGSNDLPFCSWFIFSATKLWQYLISITFHRFVFTIIPSTSVVLRLTKRHRVTCLWYTSSLSYITSMPATVYPLKTVSNSCLVLMIFLFWFRFGLGFFFFHFFSFLMNTWMGNNFYTHYMDIFCMAFFSVFA